jgi:hypothetical protein
MMRFTAIHTGEQTRISLPFELEEIEAAIDRAERRAREDRIEELVDEMLQEGANE